MASKEITLSDGKIVSMREPLVRDMRAVQGIKDQLEQDARMMSNLTGLSPEEVDALPLKDFHALQEGFTGFLS